MRKSKNLNDIQRKRDRTTQIIKQIKEATKKHIQVEVSTFKLEISNFKIHVLTIKIRARNSWRIENQQSSFPQTRYK